MEDVVAHREEVEEEWTVFVPCDNWDTFAEYARGTRLNMWPHGKSGELRLATIPSGWSRAEVLEVLELCFDGERSVVVLGP